MNRDLRSEHGLMNLKITIGSEDTRTWEALRVLASMIARRRQGLDSSSEQSLHGAGDST